MQAKHHALVWARVAEMLMVRSRDGEDKALTALAVFAALVADSYRAHQADTDLGWVE